MNCIIYAVKTCRFHYVHKKKHEAHIFAVLELQAAKDRLLSAKSQFQNQLLGD